MRTTQPESLGNLGPKPTPAQPKPRCRQLLGFTLIELLVVIGIIAILASLLMGAIARSKRSAEKAVCANNLRQLQMAWHFYTEDNNDLLPPNEKLDDVGPSPPNVRWTGGVMTYEKEGLFSIGPNRFGESTNRQLLVEKQVGRIGPYVRAAELYKCPGDKSYIRFSGVSYLRVRSYSLNWFLGNSQDFYGTERDLRLGRFFSKFGSAINPASTFSFIDEHEDTILGGNFEIWMSTDSPFFSTPASRHSRGSNIAFVDGHLEYKRWQAGWANVPVRRTQTGFILPPFSADNLWLRERATITW